MGLSAVEARAAAGEERPLLVSVEVEPGGSADAAQVRRAIGAELGRPVLALTRRDSAPQPGLDPDLLLVNVTRERIVLSMHRRSDETVARDLPVPADRGARLRAIAWLAGNLARDQASSFLQATADFGAAPPAPVSTPIPDAAPPAPATEPPPIAAPPPPFSPPPGSTLRAAGPPPAEDAERAWSVLLSGGAGGYVDRQPSLKPTGILVQLEVAKHRPDRWIWGFGLDYPVEDGKGGGLFALGGRERRWGRVRLEAALGLGLENAPVYSTTTETITSPDGQTQLVYSSTVLSYKPAPFARAFATASCALTPSWDLVARGGVHLMAAQIGDTSWFLGAVGLRYNIP